MAETCLETCLRQNSRIFRQTFRENFGPFVFVYRRAGSFFEEEEEEDRDGLGTGDELEKYSRAQACKCVSNTQVAERLVGRIYRNAGFRLREANEETSRPSKEPPGLLGSYRFENQLQESDVCLFFVAY